MTEPRNPKRLRDEPITDVRLAHPVHEGRPILMGDYIQVRQPNGVARWERVTQIRWVHWLAEVWLHTDLGDTSIFRDYDVLAHRTVGESLP